MRTLIPGGVHGGHQVGLSRTTGFASSQGRRDLCAVPVDRDCSPQRSWSGRGDRRADCRFGDLDRAAVGDGGTPLEAAKSLGLGIPRLRGLTAECAGCASLAIAQTAVVIASGAEVTYDATSVWSWRGCLPRPASPKKLCFAAICSGTCADASPSGGRGSRRRFLSPRFICSCSSRCRGLSRWHLSSSRQPRVFRCHTCTSWVVGRFGPRRCSISRFRASPRYSSLPIALA